MEIKKTEEIQLLKSVSSLLSTLRQLRDPVLGCPWDRAQTPQSLRRYFVEETAEFLEALDTRGPDDSSTWEELGDVLFQVLLHCQLGEERGTGSLARLCENLEIKLKARHPHVFDPEFPRFKTPQEVAANWELIKARFKSDKPLSREQSLPDPTFAVGRSLPALTRAARMGEKAASLGFDWSEASQIVDKALEETEEFVATGIDSPQQQAQNQLEEWGDIVFSWVQWARFEGHDPEILLQAACDKFQRRMNSLLEYLKARNETLKDLSSEDLEKRWQEIKRLTPITSKD